VGEKGGIGGGVDCEHNFLFSVIINFELGGSSY
jgi:hypothetical protein